MESESPSNEKQTIVLASGYFSPLHSSHIEYLELSKALGDVLIVVVNNDRQEELKKGKVFIECHERMKIIKSLRCVNMVVEAVDEDKSISKTLSYIRPDIFTNGGDQFNDNIPEVDICKKLGIKMVDGLGDKKQSSAGIIARAKEIANYKDKSGKGHGKSAKEHTSAKEPNKKPVKRKNKQSRPN